MRWPKRLHGFGDEILSNQRDADVGGNSQVKGRVAHPQMSETFVFGSLEHGVEYVFIGERSVRPFLHFL